MKGRCPPVTSIDPLLQLLAFFYIYAFLGWCVEIAFHAVTTGHLVNRGMLAGPVCPIYGAGMIAMVLCTEPLQESWLLTFLGAMVICTIIELLVGLVLRALFHTQWWDYSSEPFNIAGLICLRFSIYWGLGGAFLVKVVHPSIRDAVNVVPDALLFVIVVALTVVMLCDLVITVRGIRHLQSQNALLFDIEAQMRETTAAIGSAITERTLDAQEYLEPLQDRFDEWQSENREERAARRARINARLAAFDARRDALEARLAEQNDDAAARMREALARFDELRAHRRALLENRPRLAARLEKAFPTMKWLNRKK